MTEHEPVVRAEAVTRTFPTPAGEIVAVRDVTLAAEPGELLVVRGPSGSGKTTLLNLFGGIERPTSGRVVLDGVDTSDASEDTLLRIRRESVAFIFQSFGLLPVLTATENVEVPLRIRRTPVAERAARVAEALDVVGLSGHAAQRPDELSGGQQQRVAIARALVAEPRLLIADEPTGQLDSRTAASIMDLLVTLIHARGIAAVVSTHDPALLGRADRVATIHDGRLVDVSTGTAATSGVPVTGA